MWFAATEDAASVASRSATEAVMRKNYMALVTPKEAEKFWACVHRRSKTPYVKPTQEKEKK